MFTPVNLNLNFVVYYCSDFGMLMSSYSPAISIFITIGNVKLVSKPRNS